MSEIDYESAVPVPTRRGSLRGVMLIGLLLLGAQLWLLTDFWLVRRPTTLLVYAAAIAIAWVPGVSRGVERANGYFIPGGPAGRTFAAWICVSVGAGVALYAIAVGAGRVFTPIVHDEFSYLLQARMFAEGHLWLPAHPLGAFFDTFYVITDRAYASQYFPGTALLLAPGAWLNLPDFAMPLCISAAACGAVFLVLRELFDAAAGVAGVVVLIGVISFRYVAISSLSQAPALLLAMLAFWSLLRWDATRRRGWIVATGLAIGWLAITRPLEAVVFGACGVGLVAWRAREMPWRERRRIAIAGLAPLLPFCALQLVINRGVTGRWLETPFAYYAARDMPGTSLGFRPLDPTLRPLSPLPQKQAFFETQVVPAAQKHQTAAMVLDDWIHRRLKVAIGEMFPDMLLIVLVPASLLAMNDARRLMVALAMPLWWIAYSFHTFNFFHYYVVLVPSMLVLSLAGFDAIASARPRSRARLTTLRFTLPTTIAMLTLPGVRTDVLDQVVTNPIETRLRSLIASAPEPRIIVLVRYAPAARPEQEVVYNIGRAWPDDARAIRAHDLGPRDVELYRYYAARQPDRVVYRFDRGTDAFTRLGTVVDLARDPAAERATTTP